MNMSKSRDIQAKMPSPKVIFYAFWLVTVKVLNSYADRIDSYDMARGFCDLRSRKTPRKIVSVNRNNYVTVSV